MTRFNIIGHGFIELEQGGGLSFKAENQWFRFADISLGRSVEFSIPATERNRLILGFADDPARYGDMMRQSLDCQMIYDGGAVMGTLNVTGYDDDAFKCAFIMGNAAWLDELQGRQLKDCPCYIGSLYWATDSVVYDAEQADQYTHHGRQLLRYDNGLVGSSVNWQLAPSVNVRYFVDEILTNMGIRHNLDIPFDLWMVSGSMKGGTEYSVTFDATADDAATVTSTPYFDVVDIDIEWASFVLFGAFWGGGSFPAKGFRALQDVKVTFPQSMPSGVFLIKWDSKLGQCKTLAGETLAGYSGGRYGCPKLQGATIELAEGDIVFFANSTAPDIFIAVEYGWQHTAAPYTFTATVQSNGNLQLGEEWHLQYNMPEMTVFEFLKSVARAVGMELTVSPAGIRIGLPSYSAKSAMPIEDVVSVDSVTRSVNAWGASTRVAAVEFDSEDYVDAPIVAGYDVPNQLLDGDKDYKIALSEGALSQFGVLIRDVDATSPPAKFVGKKWTLARVVQGEKYLQRVEVSNIGAYNDIAANSTCVTMKVLISERDFFRLTGSLDILLTWRGVAFVWTDAAWRDGVAQLTLQKVSQPAIEEPPLPYDAEVEYLESTGTQYIDLGITAEATDVIQLDMQFTETPSSKGVFGSRKTLSAEKCTLVTGSAGPLRCSIGNSGNINILTPSLDRHVVVIDVVNGTASVDGQAAITIGQFTQSTVNLHLFTISTSGTIMSPSAMKCYSLSIGTRMDLIPVRVGSVGYMYDRVSGQLLGNSGTGDFIVGPDLP